MVVWLIALAALMFGLYNVFMKASSAHIDAVLGAVVLQCVAALFGVAMLVGARRASDTPLHATSRGVWIAILAGVAIGIVEILTFYVFKRGVDVSVGNPIIVGGSLVVTTVVGAIVLGEPLNAVQIVAVVAILAGVVLLGWGASMSAVR